MSYMFCGGVPADPNTTSWNTSKIEDMAGMFYSATKANPDVSCWDVS